ncbi:MAG: endonuclease/exonuclease/phosphatase family protein [Pirellulales bacterium]
MLATRLRLAISVLAWTYAGTVLFLVSVFQLLPNDAWLPTVLLYAPRWVWAIPGLLLLTPAVFQMRKLVLPLVMSVLLVVWLVMGFSLPWRMLLVDSDETGRLRVLSCNCGGPGFEASRLLALIDDLQPDVVALQECSSKDAEAIRAPGTWHFHREDDLTLFSRFPIERTQAYQSKFSTWHPTRAVTYQLRPGPSSISFVNLHLETPREGLEALLGRDRDAIATIRQNTIRRRNEANAVASLADGVGRPGLLAGDFNLPVESSLYEDAFGSYQNAFSRAGWGFGYTKFTRWHGVRIDHILGTDDWSVRRCWVGTDVGSDHRPVIADVSLLPQ